MSGSTRLDVAALATSGVLTADELMKAVEAKRRECEDAQTRHLTHAAITAAVAVGAFELLRRDQEKEGERKRGGVVVVEEHDSDEVIVGGREHRHDGHGHHDYHHHHHHDDSYCYERDHSPYGHKRRLLEEIGGAYSLGQEMIGHKKHHLAHLVSDLR